ncbi:MAG TPA: HlyD family efflux transporter periplasmic adaptor subunit [Thermoanaerobaculia bacterium]|jgi:HlyD family secretion protein|nr:HlyD family efflux transporter periplasmic adaptor subunit [Thermoanaerobaculia bacterium]
MDIARPERAQLLRRRRIIWGGAAVLVVAAGSLALARLEPAAPSIEGGTLWIDSVKRGEMLREVRGQGTLEPEREQWISADNAGQVVQVVLRPGANVTPDSVILRMTNPELAQQAQEAQSQLSTAEADLRVLEAQLATQLLNQEAEAAGLSAQLAEARLQVEANERLHTEKLIPDITLKVSRLHADEMTKRQQLEEQRLARLREANAAQVAGRRSQLEQLRTMQRLRNEQMVALQVKAGIAGILQEVAVEAGQRVNPGTILARVAQPDTLKAELRIPETQAKDVAVGQVAQIDTRNGIVAGRVARIDPAARQGTVAVDVTFTGPMPPGSRPDLSVDGTIEIERLPDVLYMSRPAFGQPGEKIGLFRVSPDGDTAQRVTVQLGRASTHTIEVVSGLNKGDKVILSDTNEWDGYSRLRLH